MYIYTVYIYHFKYLKLYLNKQKISNLQMLSMITIRPK